MTPEAHLIERLAHAVAEGSTVDWEEALSSAADSSERFAVEQLRTIDGIAHGVPSATVSLETARALDITSWTLASGQLLGQRYRVQSCLGRGGMGEVWHAYDLKLCVEVALKRVYVAKLGGAKALELLHREVRSARSVLSPNVCRIYDLTEVEGQELVSMEYVDGTTVREVLRSRGPLDIREAMEIASQFLAGLAAIHEAGLIHRDIKPENVMLTRSGRVVLMDFGLAKPQTEDRTATIAGTPAYMAPEQVRGGHLDARTDIFAAGVVLAELIHADRLADRESREQLYRGVHEDPPRLPDNRWRPMLLRAIAKEAADRYPSARALQRTLEKVTLRVEGAEQLEPYPGLACFTEQDAEYFFGRELEVEAVWKKLRGRHLLGLIGPSGAGKSSFLRAGLLPAMPEGWSAVVCHPGDAPLAALAQTLVDAFAGDTDGLRRLVRSNELDAVVQTFKQWRERHEEVLLIVDQFEELFTLNREEEQARFAEVLGRLAVEGDVHVLVAMRDDFLFRCHEHPALSPMLSELTLLGPPTGAAVRRAIVQPALLCGYRFEDDSLVEEMLEEVSRERGALPLLAFAVARLWEHRDRDRGLLTREAYDQIGGVEGALAQHAEATMERIGGEQLSIVRELFRNLITAQGTRASRDVDDLLSVFDERGPAEQVLRQLVDSRLLTSFEYTTGEGEGERTHRRVEIIHESLLSAWPRLVRWRTQDVDSAQLRDQLRQAASMWQERDRSNDLLWSGTAYQEFEVWRARYPGGLTTTEDAFAGAMKDKAARSRRLRRIALTAAFALLFAVLGIVSWSGLEQRSARLRAEASSLLSLGRIQLEKHPTAALAYTIASLETADTEEARRFALEVLWRGPTAFSEDSDVGSMISFSPDGNWQARSGTLTHANGLHSIALPDGPFLEFSGNSQFYYTFVPGEGRTKVWSLPEGEQVASFLIHGASIAGPSVGDVEFWSMGTDPDQQAGWFRRWQLDTGKNEELIRFPLSLGGVPGTFDPGGKWAAYGENLVSDGALDVFDLVRTKNVDRTVRAELYAIDVEGSEIHPPRRFGTAEGKIVTRLTRHPDGKQVAVSVLDYASGKPAVELWSVEGQSSSPLRSFPVEGEFPTEWVYFDKHGRWMIAAPFRTGGHVAHLWDLTAPPGADPILLHRGESTAARIGLHPGGNWATTGQEQTLSAWPLGRAYPHALRGHESPRIEDVTFDPKGRWIVTAALDGTVRLWPFSVESGSGPRTVFEVTEGALPNRVEVSPDGEYLVFNAIDDTSLFIVPVMEGVTQKLGDQVLVFTSLAVGPRKGRIAATGGPAGGSFSTFVEHPVIHVWEPGSDEARKLGEADGPDVHIVEFVEDGRLLALEESGLVRLWDLDTDESEVLLDDAGELGAPKGLLRPSRSTSRLLSPDGRYLLIGRRDSSTSARRLGVYDLKNHSWLREVSRHLCSLGGADASNATLDARVLLPGAGCTTWPVWHPSSKFLVTGSQDGTVRLVSLDGGEPHLLLGHEGIVSAVDVHPAGEWIASTGHDGTLRLWPMPKGRPLQTLPYEELLAKLRSLTNYRVVQEEGAASGYRVTYDKLPPWDEVPTW